MAYTVGVDPFEFEAAGFQPGTQACDCSLVDTDVNNHVDVLGHADWFDATLKSEQPHHLTANKAPASRKFYVELEQDLPGFLLSWRHRFQHYRVHKISWQLGDQSAFLTRWGLLERCLLIGRTRVNPVKPSSGIHGILAGPKLDSPSVASTRILLLKQIWSCGREGYGATTAWSKIWRDTGRHDHKVDLAVAVFVHAISLYEFVSVRLADIELEPTRTHC
jgi:hypothetical protein